ncbi:uncharacterized protein J4E78_005565 [Alternaria triticimaculans]|uniref:uncharacterized protein n=1 Tax=Alternaria triticimaculans TaxID=297637 RepID=UPI0020C55F66|nr:uncharacterized protein J4E78_005565 [Alternaria triticimaculans]KAI4659141.1 hypothetical protein J4E78_005565 [Alternaria triticimaculans]
MKWLTSGFDRSVAKHDHFIPFDESMPFTETDLFNYKVPDIDHASLLADQAIFKPVTIRKLRHPRISSSERLPFVGGLESIKSGSQGQVVKATIAQSHWEIQEDETQNDANFVPGNPNSTKVVALKIFEAVEPARDMVEATRDFEIELKILKELRTSNTKHDMILLDWGSITELDGAGKPTRQSLIFELASFSLGDLLNDKNRAQEDIEPSRLLASLVDIVEALECLHHQLKTLHLDIKPDNILIFETFSGTGNERQSKLTWKLSDFGLARKRDAKKRRLGSAQTSTATSRTSTQPATRPPGLYQAPEIQEEETSVAGQGSDVWSMGCVTLMVLAFIADGSKAVRELETFLMVDFMNCAGKEPLFYVRSDSYQWEDRDKHICCYLPEQAPNVCIIPGPGRQFSAALHPFLIHWSNTLLRATYDRRIEQRFVLAILKVIFGRVLRVDRNQRIGATELRDRLAKIQRDWKSYDLAPKGYEYCYLLEELRLLQDGHAEEHGPSRQRRSDEFLALQEPETCHSILETASPPPTITGSRATLPDTLHNSLHSISSSGDSLLEESIHSQDRVAQTQDPIVVMPYGQVQAQDETTASMGREAPQDQRDVTPEQNPQIQRELCSAIERDDTASVRLQLEQNPEILAQLLPSANKHPIHWALSNNAYKALDALLEKASREITNLPCSRRTALDIALDSGKPAALDCIRKHRDKFEFPLALYEKRKKNLGREAKEIADDLFAIKKAAAPKQRTFLGLRRSRTSNLSA